MRVNGETISLTSPMTLQEFLESKGYQIHRIVVERNGDIITREQFNEVTLHDEDRLEVVHFVGGG